jgi:hypothetical protein
LSRASGWGAGPVFDDVCGGKDGAVVQHVGRATARERGTAVE